MTRVMAPESAVIDRENDSFYCPVFGVRPVGYDDARDAEKAELDRERIRLWYVAATRARELLVIPRLDVDPVGTASLELLDLSLADLPPLALAHLPAEPGAAQVPPAHPQNRTNFQDQDVEIATRKRD